MKWDPKINIHGPDKPWGFPQKKYKGEAQLASERKAATGKDPSFNWTKEQRRSATRKAGGPRMSLAQLEKANVKKFQPYFTPGPDSVYLGKNPSGAAMQQVLEDAGSPRLMQQSKGRMANKLLKGGGGLRLPQLGKGGIGGMMAMLMMMMAMGMMGGNNKGNDSSLDEVLGNA